MAVKGLRNECTMNPPDHHAWLHDHRCSPVCSQVNRPRETSESWSRWSIFNSHFLSVRRGHATSEPGCEGCATVCLAWFCRCCCWQRSWSVHRMPLWLLFWEMSSWWSSTPTWYTSFSLFSFFGVGYFRSQFYFVTVGVVQRKLFFFSSNLKSFFHTLRVSQGFANFDRPFYLNLINMQLCSSISSGQLR